MKGVTIEFIPYSELAYRSSYKRVKMLVELASTNRILLVQGRLTAEEEADLIEETMRKIGKSRRFKGIELASFKPEAGNLSAFQSLKEKIATGLFGHRDEITVIGPATIVREIKKDPRKIQLLLKK
ncbi:MAG: DUF2073 domain-containing protein [archaeon]